MKGYHPFGELDHPQKNHILPELRPFRTRGTALYRMMTVTMNARSLHLFFLLHWSRYSVRVHACSLVTKFRRLVSEVVNRSTANLLRDRPAALLARSSPLDLIGLVVRSFAPCLSVCSRRLLHNLSAFGMCAWQVGIQSFSAPTTSTLVVGWLSPAKENTSST